MDAGDADVEDVAFHDVRTFVAVVVVAPALDDDRVVAAFSLRAALRPRRATDVSDAGMLRRLRCGWPRGARSRPRR